MGAQQKSSVKGGVSVYLKVKTCIGRCMSQSLFYIYISTRGLALCHLWKHVPSSFPAMLVTKTKASARNHIVPTGQVSRKG